MSQIAGIMNVSTRDEVAPRAGQVWPSPWKMPEQVKISPDATKLIEAMRRKCEPTSITPASCVNNDISHSGRHCVSSISTSIRAVLILAAPENVSRTRPYCCAP